MEPFHIILDLLPVDYKGWLIRTDFRVGMQLCICLDDKTISDSDRTMAALRLLYGNGIPDARTAIEGLNWFLRCGGPERNDLTPDDRQLVFYGFDAGRIWASFKASFGIDLHTAQLHWFEFCYLLASLREDTSLSAAMEIRETSTKDLKGAERRRIVNAKRALTPPEPITEADKEQSDAFREEMRRIAEVQRNGR